MDAYDGIHPHLVDVKLFQRVQQVLAGHNRPKYSKLDIAFRGIATCNEHGCMITGEIKKEKYIYYRCTGYRDKCSLPRMREADLAERLGEPLKHLQVPESIVHKIIVAIQKGSAQLTAKREAEQKRLEARLATIRRRMDDACNDKLDGKIPEEFWERKNAEWRVEDYEVRIALKGATASETSDRVMDATRILELANKAYLLYKSQNSTEQAKLLRMLVSNCSVDAVNVRFTYRKPFDLIFERGQSGKWSGRLDSN